MSKEPLTTEELEKKRRNRTITILVGVIVAGIIGSAGYTIFNLWKLSQQMAKEDTGSKSKIVQEKEVQRGWKEITEERLTQLEDNQRKIAENLNRIQKNQEELHKKLQEIESKISKLTLNREAIQPTTPVKSVKKEKGLPKEQLEELAPPPKTYTHPTFKEKLKETPTTEKQKPELVKFTPQNVSENNEGSSPDNSTTKPVIKIPTGFVRGITLTGLDAPTFQWGINNPHPILISLEDKEILANNKKLNLKACFVLGSGYGEVSSERAYIRLIKISCITKDKKLLEQKVKGWIVDDDGKIGLKGRLVTKQGAYLARSLVAGFLSGIAKILQAGASTISVSPLGATATINSSQAAKAGIFSGTANAMDRLAAFYEKMAEQIFPVIEIAPGRKVAILFEGGDQLGKGSLIKLNPLGDSK